MLLKNYVEEVEFESLAESLTQEESNILQLGLALDHFEKGLNESQLNEGTMDKLKTGLKKVLKKKKEMGEKAGEKSGIEAKKKHNPGLIRDAMDFSKGIGKALKLSVEASQLKKKDDDESKERINEIKSELKELKISKQRMMNFLYNLDLLTLHMVSGPIHMFAALTGYEIEVAEIKKEIKNKTGADVDDKGLISGIAEIITSLKDKIKNHLSNEKYKAAKPALARIEKLIQSEAS